MPTCPNGIRKTFIVSTPRSGHHLLVRGLEAALNHKMVYSEFYNCAHNMANCEWVNVQKSHDFELDMPILEGYLYIVLIREKEDCLKSWYESTKTKYEGNLIDFDAQWSGYYEGFTHKWTNSRDNVWLFKYPDWTVDKIQTLTDVLQLMEIEPNEAKLEQWAKNEDLTFSKI